MLAFIATDPIAEAATPQGGVPEVTRRAARRLIADTYKRLAAALDADKIPAGGIANALSSLGKLAIADAEIAAAAIEPPTAIIYSDPWHDELPAIVDRLEHAMVRLGELHTDAVQVLSKLDQDLARYRHGAAEAVRAAVARCRSRLNAPDP